MGEIWEMHRMLTSRDVVSKRKIKCSANKQTLKLKVSIVAISEQTSNWGCLEKEQWKECKNCITMERIVFFVGFLKMWIVSFVSSVPWPDLFGLASRKH